MWNIPCLPAEHARLTWKYENQIKPNGIRGTGLYPFKFKKTVCDPLYIIFTYRSLAHEYKINLPEIKHNYCRCLAKTFEEQFNQADSGLGNTYLAVLGYGISNSDTTIVCMMKMKIYFFLFLYLHVYVMYYYAVLTFVRINYSVRMLKRLFIFIRYTQVTFTMREPL
jgi:hypothetical protein